MLGNDDGDLTERVGVQHVEDRRTGRERQRLLYAESRAPRSMCFTGRPRTVTDS